MFIRSISVQNFKTLELDEFEFKDYNIIIGPNSAGKSNLVSFFKFIADIINDDLESAISRQGGVKNILNFNQNSNEISFKLKFSEKIKPYDKIAFNRPVDVIYTTKIRFENNSPIILEEKINLNFLYSEEMNIQETIPEEIIKEINQKINANDNEIYQKIPHELMDLEFYTITAERINNEISITTTYPDENDLNIRLMNSLQSIRTIFERKSYKDNSLFLSDYNFILGKLSTIRVFDIDTKTIMKPSSQKSEKYLVPSGQNLVNRLEKIFYDNKKKKDFLNMYQSFLPYVKGAKIERENSNYSSLYIDEMYNDNPTPPELISDGTLGIVAIIMTLYYEDLDITLLEEPEKYLHPEIIRKLANAIEDTSMYKQVIITTHSSELLKHMKKEHVIFVSREQNGLSKFIYPSTDEKVKEFMSNDLQLEDLFINNFLGVI